MCFVNYKAYLCNSCVRQPVNKMTRYRIFAAVAFASLTAVTVMARDYVVTGRVLDGGNKDAALVGATIRLLKTDSSAVAGQMIGDKGRFRLIAKKRGDYLLECKFVGYKNVWKNVAFANKDSVNVGDIRLVPSDIAIKGAAKVTGTAAKMTQKKDTLIFNAAAFKTMEGSTLKKLVEQLPGVVVDDDGNITVNGKEVTEIKINGKDFFKGDTQVAMDNLPVNLVDKVRTYEEKSDYTKHTGVDDGEKKTVLDINLKKELKSTVTSRGNIGNGTDNRYRDDLFVNRFTDKNRQTLWGNMSNLGGWGWGLHANKELGTNLQWMNKEKWGEPGRYQLSVGLKYRHDDDDVESTRNSETFLTGTDIKSFSNSVSRDRNRRSEMGGNISLEWSIDSLTSLWAYTSLNGQKSDNRSDARSAKYDSDPYATTVADPLSNMFSDSPDESLRQIAVNRNMQQDKTDSKYFGWDGSFGLYHRLDTMNSHLIFEGDWGLSHTGNHRYNLSDIQYYKVDGNQKPQSYYNQYVRSPQTSRRASVGGGYIHGFTKNTHLGMRYRFRYNDDDNDRAWYQLDSLLQYKADNYPQLGTLPTNDSLQIAYNVQNSQYTTYKNIEHAFSLEFNYTIPKKLTWRADLSIRPIHTTLDYTKGTFHTLQKRDRVNIWPHTYLRYELGENHTLDFRYHGGTNQPDILSLIDVPDESNPLYITRGNNNLKASWENTLQMHYNLYMSKTQQSVNAHFRFNNTYNSISNTITYIPETGVQISRPENINGNWSWRGNVGYNRSLGKNNRFQIEAQSGINMNNSVGFVSVGTGTETTNVKNTVRSTRLSERIGASYRVMYFDARFSVDFNYNHARADKQKNADMDIYRMNYFVESHVRTKWDMELGSNIRIQNRRGYTDPQMNTNEYIWDANLTQSFLKDKQLTLGIEVRDILRSRKNVHYDVNASGKTETRINAIGRYVLFKLTYKLNIFGGSNKA